MVALLGVAAMLSVVFRKLTITAAFTGWVIAITVFRGAGFTGVAMMAAFFLLATFATSVGLNKKLELELAETDKGKRNAQQVFANAGVALILGLLIIFFPQKTGLFQLMMAAGFASATADTLSSELGNIYGRKFVNIITFKKDRRGTDGVISAEGTCIGITGSLIIALIYSPGTGESFSLLIIIFAGTAGNLADSILGATLERKGYLNNNAVNFCNTLTGAITAGCFGIFLG
jgi:uncharacterized protein (TIGR00297 family)